MRSYTSTVLHFMLVAVFFCTLVSIALLPRIAHGADPATGQFVALENFQDSAKLSNLYSESDPGDLSTYINKLFFYAVSLGALLAVLRLTWAGYLYMSTDAFGKKEHAKEVIWDTGLGLLLLLSVYLILYQINPHILDLKVNIGSLQSSTEKSPPPQSSTEKSPPPPPTGIGSGLLNYTWTNVGTVKTGTYTFRPQSCTEVWGGGWIDVDGKFCGVRPQGSGSSCCGYDPSYTPPPPTPTVPSGEATYGPGDPILPGSWCAPFPDGKGFICNTTPNSCQQSYYNITGSTGGVCTQH